MDAMGDSDRLLSLLPPIRRARFWRLYAQDGGRFLDFWMDGGRDILGAKGTGLGTAIKATVDLGVSRPLPSVWKARLTKQVAELWPAFEARRFYLSEERALAALGRALGTKTPFSNGATAGESRRDELVFDPVERPPESRSRPVLLLRAFAERLEASRRATWPATRFAAEPAFAIGLVRPPCPRVFAPAILVFRDIAVSSRMEEDLVPPIMLATASRSLWEFERFASTYDEKLWQRVDRRLGPFFERLGPYLYPRHPASEHEAVFRKALAAGAILSPCHSLPSLIPGDFDDGELARLATALSR